MRRFGRRNGFLFGGPRVANLSSLGQFIPLPNITNRWHRLSADVRYCLASERDLAKAVSLINDGPVTLIVESPVRA